MTAVDLSRPTRTARFSRFERGSTAGLSESVSGSEEITSEGLDSDDGLVLREQLATLRHIAEHSASKEEKAHALSRIEDIEKVIANSAYVVSQENFVTCRNVNQLEPIGVTDQFSHGRVYAFARIQAPREERLALVWSDEQGNKIGERELKAKQNEGRGFRTFSYRTLRKRGAYEVRLYNQDGYLIVDRRLTVK